MQQVFLWLAMLTLCAVAEPFKADAALPSPPRGWNSWDSYSWIINETQVLENANAMVQYLKPFGYEFIVIDGGWMSDLNNKSNVSFDEFGRLIPNAQRFPHGFKWLSDQIHSMQLKFGVHTTRGIHYSVVAANLSVYGTNNSVYTSQIVSEPYQWCVPNNPSKNPYLSVDIDKYGGQEYYNSLYQQYCQEWSLDFIKFDCVYGNKYVYSQIKAAEDSILYECNKNNNNIIYSISPGNYATPYNDTSNVDSIYNISNMYRITGDTWDKWPVIIRHFNVTAEYAQLNFIGKQTVFNNNLSWPDLDMLPIGYLTTPNSGYSANRTTNLTKPQQRVLMSLWSIARSPLIFGGAMTFLENDTFTLNLLTNEYLLDINSYSVNNQQIYVSINQTDYTPIQSIWRAFIINNNTNIDYYVAMFNLADTNIDMSISFDKIGIVNQTYQTCKYQSIWDSNIHGITQNKMIHATVNANDVVFYLLNECK